MIRVRLYRAASTALWHAARVIEEGSNWLNSRSNEVVLRMTRDGSKGPTS